MSRQSAFVGVDVGTTGVKAVAYTPDGHALAQGSREYVEGAGFSAPLTGLIVIAIASGATAFFHVNDSSFWLVGRYLGISEKHTLRYWTAMVTIVGLVGFCTALLISLLLS